MNKSICRKRGGKARWVVVSGAVVVLSLGVIALTAGSGRGWGGPPGHGWGHGGYGWGHQSPPPPPIIVPPVINPVIVPPVVVPPPNITNTTKNNNANVNTMINIDNDALINMQDLNFGYGGWRGCGCESTPWRVPLGFDFDLAQSGIATVIVDIKQS